MMRMIVGIVIVFVILVIWLGLREAIQCDERGGVLVHGGACVSKSAIIN